MRDLGADFVEFARWQVESGDVDPVYPTLRALLDVMDLSPDERLRFVVFYEAWYSLPSALTAWQVIDGWHGQRVSSELARLPTGVERRGLRGGGITDHLINAWEYLPRLAMAPDWNAVRAVVEQVPGNGRWASYKLAELCQKVLGWAITPTDAGHADSTGPRHGLALLTGDDPLGNSVGVIARLDRATAEWTECLQSVGVADVAETETMLCDFHSLVDGRYYVGHDWDLMLHHCRLAPAGTRRMIERARAAATDARWLGEVSGWPGERRELLPLYERTGRLSWWL